MQVKMSPQEFKQARTELGLSVSEMAIAIGIASPRSIRQYENGERQISGVITKLISIYLRYPELVHK